MALATYSDLNTAVANWTGRVDLTARIPEGIALAEAKMNRKLRTKDMETKNAAFAIGGEYVAVPSGFGGVRMWHLNDSPRSIISLMPEDMLTSEFGDGSSGDPVYYSVQGGNFRIQPAPSTSQTSTLVYYLQVPALTASNTTNWLMTSHPDAYLYGVNAEMCGFMKDWDSGKVWETMMYQVLNEIAVAANKDKYSGASLVMRPG